ncbi:CheR family methyltransferase [Viridibacterium curvum]|uniref:Chemotaxis protein methyltransferase n=1 Tax=Viridibacterium curvum TaxID=1101404 RepID=A0ABP9QWZ6_9RHOO
MIGISDGEFRLFQQFILNAAGITLSDAKKALVCGRLEKRLHAHSLNSYRDYLSLITSASHKAEQQIAIDLLTTNETYFFREPKHFNLLARCASECPASRLFRVWSAASSSGEEAYSMAMTLADCRPHGEWEIFGSDISTRVLEKARRGHYPMERAKNISPDFLKRFCLKGTGPQAGTLLVTRELRERVRFGQINLNEALPNIGEFDVIFLRNVMIYFSNDTKRQIVSRIVGCLRRGGYLCIGHSESLNGICDTLQATAPSIYRKP